MRKLTFLLLVGALGLVACGNNTTEETAKDEQSKETSQTVTPVDLTVFKNIKLLSPSLDCKAPLMAAMQNRQSAREYADKPLSLEDLSNIMWAAYGVNRPDDGKRTVPSAMAVYPLKVYAVLSNGIYFYDAANNELQAVAEGDFRKLAGGTQTFVHNSPLNIIYMVDMNKYMERFSDRPADGLKIYAMSDASHCSENVYLYCAAFNLNTVIRGAGFDEPELVKLLNLDDKHHVLLAQTVGYPK
jgi:SagB-type dehydrogenase family enzyme